MPPAQESSSSGSDSSGDSGDEGDRGQETTDSTFASQFEDGLVIDSASDHEGTDLMEQFDDGFATSGVGDDAIPTYDLESLAELQVDEGAGGNNNNDNAASAANPASPGPAGRTGKSGFQKTTASNDAAKLRSESGTVRVGAQKRVSPLEELRQVFNTTGGLKLSRDFTERYLFKISADGYHVGWVADAGSDYDFYNTKHEIVHSEEKREMLQLANPKLLGSGEPSPEVMETLRKAYKIKVDPTFVSNVSKGFMYQVNKEGKQIGWSCKSGRDVEFYDMRGKFLCKVAQRNFPKLSMGARDVMKEVRRVYDVEKTGLRLKNVGSSRAKFKYKVVEQTEKEKHLGWANISSGYYLFFDKEGKKRLHAVSRYEMPQKDRWRGHTKSFGISNELKTTATGSDYSEKGNKPQGIFGLIDTSEIPGFVEDGQREPKQGAAGAKDADKKKKKKKKGKKHKPKVKTVVKYNIAGVF